MYIYWAGITYKTDCTLFNDALACENDVSMIDYNSDMDN